MRFKNCELCDIIFLKEHWLLPFDFDFLNHVHDSWLGFDNSAVDTSTRPALVAEWVKPLAAVHTGQGSLIAPRAGRGLSASPAGDRPIGSCACYRIIPGQAQRVYLCPL